MAVLLHIDTSTSVCSAALSVHGEVVALHVHEEGMSHSRLIGSLVQNLLDFAHQQGWALDAVALSAGPGSYTGLRIGCSFAKGLCYGTGLPLLLLNTLQVMAANFRRLHPTLPGRLCPMIDARRMEVFTAVYEPDLREYIPPRPLIIDHEPFLVDTNQTVQYFGDGAAKCRPVLDAYPQFHYTSGITPQADGMVLLAEQAFAKQCFADLAYCEPFYLKEFQTTTPKKKW